MKATLEQVNSVQKRVKVTIPLDKVNIAFDKAFQKIQRKVKIQGFRPGKAPLGLVKQLYQQDVSHEVTEALVQDHLFAALKEHEVRPVSTPVVENLAFPEKDKEFEFTALVDIMPQIALGEHYKKLSVTCPQIGMTEVDVKKSLRNFARRQVKAHPVDVKDGIKADDGHEVLFTFKVSMNGTELPDLSSDKGHWVVLGEQEASPEIEACIKGMKIGESKSIQLNIPNQHPTPEYAGKPADYEITLKEMNKLEYPNFDDELAKDLGFDSLDALEKFNRQNMEQQTNQRNVRFVEEALLKALVDLVPFEVPPALVDQVVDSMIEEFTQSNSPGGKDKDLLKKALKDDKLRSTLRPEAKQKAQNTMLLWEVIKKENIQIQENEVKDHIRQSYNAPPETEVTKIFQEYGDRMKENLLFDKAMNLLKEQAKITFLPPTKG